MEFTLTTPTLLFGAISLLMLAYTNRFLALARIVRELSDLALQRTERSANLRRQVANLRLRIGLIKAMQALGILAFLFCVVSMLCLFFEADLMGRWMFGFSLFLLSGSLVFSFWEILLSGNALSIELEKLGGPTEARSPDRS